MTKATILVLHAGGTHFSLKTLYNLALAEEKDAKRQVDYKVAHDLAIADAKSTATMMSSITDSDGYTSVNRCSSFPTISPPRPHSQSVGKENTRKNPFDNRFLNTFFPTFTNSPTVKVSVDESIMGIEAGGKSKKNNAVPVCGAAQDENLGKTTYDGPGQRRRKAKENTPSHSKYPLLIPSLKGVGAMAIKVPEGGSDKGLGDFAGGGKTVHENNHTLSHDKYAVPSLSLKTMAEIEFDLDEYANDPASHQPSKKALCADQTSLVTAAQSSSSSISPKQISIYSNKRNALSSPAKGGMLSHNIPHGRGQPQRIPPAMARITPKADLKEVFDDALEPQEAQWEAERSTRKERMAPYDKLVDDVEKEDKEKEAARLTRTKILREKFVEASQNKNPIKMGDHDSICDAESKEEDKEFSYHLLDGSAKEEGEDYGKLGQDADGTSPMATRSKRYKKEEDELPNWLNEINLIQSYDNPELLSAPISQIFPCVACNNHKKISDSQTWVPIILRNSGITIWELFDADFDDLGHVLEWDGDEGLGNLWGLYYQFPDDDSIKRIHGTRIEGDPALQKSEMGNENTTPFEKASSTFSDDTTATSTIVSSRGNENPTVSSTCDMDDEYELNLLAAVSKHQEDILRLFRAGTVSEKSTIPPKMLQKVRAANMASMTQANSITARAGRTNLSAKRLKELGSNAELKAKELHDAEVAEQNKMVHGTASNRTEDIEANPEIAIRVPGALKDYQMEHGSQEEEMSHDRDPDGFWRTTIPEGTQILTMANDGNCFFRSISDRLDHDHGAGHEYIRYQITNHICRNGDEFKDVLLMRDDDEEITDLDSYLHKM